MMIYVALLRGINVGGNAKIEMSKLKLLFEELEFENVKTYINSGNIVFCSSKIKESNLVKIIEAAIKSTFGFTVSVIVRDIKNIQALNKSIPSGWLNNSEVRTDVIFLWDDIDTPDILNQIKYKPELENVVYFHGAIIWNIARKNVTKGSETKLITTPFYKKMTIRNINTVRKLLVLMEEIVEK